MAIFEAISCALDSKGDEEEIRKGVDDFCGIERCIVVLRSRAVSMNPNEHQISISLGLSEAAEWVAFVVRTSSHQFSEAVTGAQYPSSGRAGG